MNNIITYRRDLPLADYIIKFRDSAKFINFCRNCNNYSKSWYCPPFTFSTDEVLQRFSNIEIIVFQIEMPRKGMSLTDARIYLDPIRKRLDEQLLTTEKQKGGLAFSFAGHCLHCGDIPCSRIGGELCRHPDKVRPSLEAYGFDLEATLTELFNMSMIWAKPGECPDPLHLIAAIAY